MGFSVVSLVEIFYFLTLRPFCRRMLSSNSNKKKKSKLNTIAALAVNSHRFGNHVPVYWIHPFDKAQNVQKPIDSMHQRQIINSLRNRNIGGRITQGIVIDHQGSDNILFPYLN